MRREFKNKDGMPYKIEKFAKEYADLNEETGYCNEMRIEDLENAGIKCTGNGCVVRAGSSLDKKYNIKKIRQNNNCLSSPIVAIQFLGYKDEEVFNQLIRSDIKKEISQRRSAWSGMPGTPSDPIEVDHKDGLKQDLRLNDPSKQKFEDFQPLRKSENDLKRQYCKDCERTAHRPSARDVLGECECFGVDFTHGDARLDKTIGCHGCFLYDPIVWRLEAREIWFNNRQKNRI